MNLTNRTILLFIGTIWVSVYIYLYIIRERLTRPITPLDLGQQNLVDYILLAGNIAIFLVFCAALNAQIRALLRIQPSWVSQYIGQKLEIFYTNFFVIPLYEFTITTLPKIPRATAIFWKIGDYWLLLKNSRKNFTSHAALILNIIPRILLCILLFISIVIYSQFNYFSSAALVLGLWLLFVRVIIYCINHVKGCYIAGVNPFVDFYLSGTEVKFQHNAKNKDDISEEDFDRIVTKLKLCFQLSLCITLYEQKTVIPHLTMLLTSIYCIIWLNVCLTRLNILLPVSYCLCLTLLNIIIFVTYIFIHKKLRRTS